MPPGPDLTVLLIQGNVAQGQKWDQALMVSIFHSYLDLTRQWVGRNPVYELSALSFRPNACSVLLEDLGFRHCVHNCNYTALPY